MTETEENTNKWNDLPRSWNGIINIMKMSKTTPNIDPMLSLPNSNAIFDKNRKKYPEICNETTKHPK